MADENLSYDVDEICRLQRITNPSNHNGESIDWGGRKWRCGTPPSSLGLSCYVLPPGFSQRGRTAGGEIGGTDREKKAIYGSFRTVGLHKDRKRSWIYDMVRRSRISHVDGSRHVDIISIIIFITEYIEY